MGEAAALAAVAAADDAGSRDEDDSEGDTDGNTDGDAAGLAESLGNNVESAAVLNIPLVGIEALGGGGGARHHPALVLGAAGFFVVVPVEGVTLLAELAITHVFGGGVGTAGLTLGNGLDKADGEESGEKFEHLIFIFI